MERILVPNFLVCKKDREVFNNIDLFRSLVREIDGFTRGENKSLNDVMKTISYLKIPKGLPSMQELFAYVKAFVLDLYRVEGRSNSNASGLIFASCDTNSKVFDKTAFEEFDSQRYLLEVAIKEHMVQFRQLKAAQRKCIMLEGKLEQVKEKLVKKFEQPAEERKKRTVKKIQCLQKKLAMNGELIELAYISYQSALEKEKGIRLKIQQLAEDLQQKIVAITREKLAESFDLLDNLAWNSHLSMYLLEKIREMDCQYASDQLYKYICQTYMYANPEEWNIRAGSHATLEDPVLLSSEFCQNKSECIFLVDFEEPDAELENPPEGIYVKATANCKEGTASSLTFRRGKRFKQKLVSRDGKIGFGWKRSSRTGMKVWGFYHVCMVKFDN
ncbi:hypothetical protein ACJMK2_040559 [Sinanodonta woodiana]|uniref:Uncharacterized protein n=1 Tax=Sinanodonta woodiana TaxID=1069815 RepID=A0ABD3W1F3_SINWO